ncbi:hypothetical protein GCM10027605_32830 [Micromonospora zhanjiangensis]
MLGARVNVEKSSPAFLVDATSTQNTGNRQYRAPISNSTVADGLIGRSARRRPAGADDLVAGAGRSAVGTDTVSPPG